MILFISRNEACMFEWVETRSTMLQLTKSLIRAKRERFDKLCVLRLVDRTIFFNQYYYRIGGCGIRITVTLCLLYLPEWGKSILGPSGICALGITRLVGFGLAQRTSVLDLWLIGVYLMRSDKPYL